MEMLSRVEWDDDQDSRYMSIRWKLKAVEVFRLIDKD